MCKQKLENRIVKQPTDGAGKMCWDGSLILSGPTLVNQQVTLKEGNHGTEVCVKLRRSDAEEVHGIFDFDFSECDRVELYKTFDETPSPHETFVFGIKTEDDQDVSLEMSLNQIMRLHEMLGYYVAAIDAEEMLSREWKIRAS